MIKKVIFLLSIFILVGDGLSYGQNHSLVDKERYAKINEYLTLAEQKLRTDSKAAIKAALAARDLSQDFSEDKLIKANILVAHYHMIKGSLDSARVILKESVTQSKSIQNDTLLALVYHALGQNYQYTGTFERAIEHFHEAIKINDSLGLVKESIKQLNNIGLLYRQEEEYDLALVYLERCFKISKENKFKRSEVYANGNIAYVLIKQEKWEEALKRLEEALALNKEIDDILAFCSLNYLISDVKLNQKEYGEAKTFALKSLEAANEVNFAVGKIYSQRVLGEVYLNEKKYNQARSIINETLNYLNENSANLYLEDLLNVSYQIEYETRNYKEALAIQNQLYTRRDSLTQIKTKEKIADSEYKYQLLKNEKEKEMLVIQNESSQQNSFLAMTIAFLLLLVFLLALSGYVNSKSQNKNLEQAIKERTKELETSNEELERFAYIASHDLKTPLRSIVSFTSLLERKLKGHDNEQVHEYLSYIKNGGLRLNNLISNTLKYSKVSSQKNENSDGDTPGVDLNTVLEEVEVFLSPYIKERSAKIIKHNSLPWLQANHSSMVLLLQNLIENSIKYNESTQPIVEISSIKKDAFISIFVKDNGIGIPSEYYDRVFVMFSRLHNQGEYEGSGLGLSICKKIVDQLGGQICIDSEVAEGCVFEIKIPLDLVVQKGLPQ